MDTPKVHNYMDKNKKNIEENKIITKTRKKQDIVFPNNAEFAKCLIKGDKTKIAKNLGYSRNYIYKVLGGFRRMPQCLEDEILRFKKINEESNIEILKSRQN